MNQNKQPELLAPCGDMERLALALQYGADAVYLGGAAFGMRQAPKNFGAEELHEAVKLAHNQQKKVYLTCNTYPHSRELSMFPAFLADAVSAGVDAVIVADMGLLSMVKRLAPKLDVHISTQAGIINYESARAYHEMGAKRIVTARELSLDEIAEIRAKTNPDLEIECFVHGAMCISFSGRCLLSSFMIGRDANCGACAQPCRWQYEITDKSRPGISYPVEQDPNGTYIMNSRDLCMIEHIPALISAGIDSFKLEGRAKSAYYTAVVTNAYRCAIDGYLKQPAVTYQPEPWLLEELQKVSHRAYSTGFYFAHPNETAQVDDAGGYINRWDVVAFITECDGEYITMSQRNKFLPGDLLELVEPGKAPVSLCAEQLFDENGELLDMANHPMMTVKLKDSRCFTPGSFVRKQAKEL